MVAATFNPQGEHLVNAHGHEILTVCMNLVPASRPRVTRWGTYYSKTYKNWMKDAEKLIPIAHMTRHGHVGIELVLAVQKPKTTKRTNPRGDIDNYMKAVLDALTKKGYWCDDDQIVNCIVIKRFTEDDEPPHFSISIYDEL